MKPIIITRESNCNITNKPIKSWKIVKNTASVRFNFPDAKGRSRVLLTFASYSLSRISFIQQPAPLMINEPRKKSIKDLINKIQKNSIEYENQTINITSSGGVAFSNESENASDLVNKADKRLYMAKKSGRNRFVLNNSEISGEK